jgi:tetratricopeptide (TPR) repeat protein
MKLVKPLLLLLAVCLLAPAALAQSPSLDEAEALYRNKDWEAAERAFEQIALREPGNGLAWARLGHIRYNRQNLRGALAAVEQAERLGFDPPTMRYDLACLHALLGNRDQALEFLDRAVASGFRDLALLREDKDLDSLRDDSRFRRIVERAENPCRHEPAYDQLDFWLGTWDVADAQGRRLGTNRIEPVSGGCAVLESWTDRDGHEGRSLFAYQPVAGAWTQVWAADDGTAKVKRSVPDFDAHGAMRFEGEVALPGGGSVRDRTTLTPLPDGRVRQVIEQSRDGGRTWTVGFDGFYSKRGGTQR